MSTCTIGGVSMYQEERPRDRPLDHPPPGFRRYVLREHQRYANERADVKQAFAGMAIHHPIRTDDGTITALPFTTEFAKYIDAGIKDQRASQGRQEDALRWARVEAAIQWLESEDKKMGAILRYFQTPAWARRQGKYLFASREDIDLTEDELDSWLRRGLRRVWWKLGYTY